MQTQNVLSIAGAKGGVGKTTTSINLGSTLVGRGRSVVLVELDLAMANVLDFLDLGLDPEADATLHDVLAGEATPSEAVYRAPGGVDVLPSGVSIDGYAATNRPAVVETIRGLREEYDVVLLDTGAGLSYETLLPLALADWTIVVSTPRVASVRDAQKTTELVSRVGGAVLGLVLVKDGTGTAPPPERIAAFLEVDLLGRVPHDESIPTSQDQGTPVVSLDVGAPAAEAYRRLAEAVDAKVFTGPGDSARLEPAVPAIEP